MKYVVLVEEKLANLRYENILAYVQSLQLSHLNGLAQPKQITQIDE